MLTAESSVLFTTLDVILDARYGQGRNKIFDLLDDGISMYLFDLFVFAEVSRTVITTIINHSNL